MCAMRFFVSSQNPPPSLLSMDSIDLVAAAAHLIMFDL